MMNTSRKRKRIFIPSDSSNSLSDTILYKTNVSENSETVHNRNSIVKENSINDVPMNDKTPPQKRFLHKLSTSDSNNIQASKINKRKRFKNNKNSDVCIDLNESCSDSSTSSNQTKRKFRKTNNKRSSSNKFMIIRCDQGTDNEHTEKDSSDSNLFVANTSKQHKKQNKNPNNTTDFKSIIIKFEEKIKNKFSQFQQFMYRSELKYFKDDKATLQDAIDILFIFNCFISKLKEELTEQQQDLANVCIEWSTQHECNCIVPNIQDKECVNGNNLQVQNGTSSQCNSSSSEILSGNILKQNSLKTIDRSTINVHKRDKTVILQQNIQNNKDELLLEASNNSAHIREDANSNVTFRSSKRLMNTVTTLAEINKSKTPEKGPVVNSKIPKNTKNSTPNPKAMNQDFVEILELLSRSDSDSSDNELTLIRNQLRNYDSHDKCKNSLTDMHEIRQGNESRSLLSEICNEEINDDVRTQASYNSDDTIIIPRKKSFNSRIQISENEDENCSETTTQIYVDSANNENSIFQQQSQFVIPNINNLNTKYYFRSNRNSGNFRPKTSSINKRKTDITDKKLQMNCKVLINKC